MHEDPSIRRPRRTRQGAGTTAGARRRRSDAVAAESFAGGAQSVAMAAQRLPIVKAMPIPFAPSPWSYGVAGTRGARRWRGRVRYRERSVPSRLLKACGGVSAIVFAARRRRGLTAGAKACGAAPRRLVELHECRVRCWALRSSGAARSKRSASDCCRWQLYAVESCGPGTRYRARLGTKSAKNPSCSPAQREEKRTARRGRAAVLKRYKPSHSSRHHGCFQQQR
jgi:hypothetical protein